MMVSITKLVLLLSESLPDACLTLQRLICAGQILARNAMDGGKITNSLSQGALGRNIHKFYIPLLTVYQQHFFLG